MNELSIIDNALLKDEQYPIDFDDAWQWVGYSTKGNALRLLLDTFKDGEDFTGIRRKPGGAKKKLDSGEMINQVKHGGDRKSIDYFLTSDCFKEFCMMAGTDKGKEVRRYFIQAEKRLRHIIDENRVNKAVRRELTDSIQYAIANGHKDMHGFEYKTYTDLIYKAVLGMNAKKYREVMGLEPTASVKESMTADQAKRVATLEKLVGSLLESGFDYEAIKVILEQRTLPEAKVKAIA